jgi:hypothetical protein
VTPAATTSSRRETRSISRCGGHPVRFGIADRAESRGVEDVQIDVHPHLTGETVEHSFEVLDAVPPDAGFSM